LTSIVGSEDSLKVKFISSNPICQVEKYEIVDATSDQVKIQGDVVTYPTSQYGAEIKFKVKATASGGASLISDEYRITIVAQMPEMLTQHRKLASCTPISRSYSRSYKFAQLSREPNPGLVADKRYMHSTCRLTYISGSAYKTYSGSVLSCNNFCNELHDCVYFARHKSNSAYRCDFFRAGCSTVSSSSWMVYRASKMYRFKAVQLPFG
jgi:hypothetical protein